MRGTPVTLFDTSKSYIMSTNGSSASFTPSGSGSPTSGAMAWDNSLSYNKGAFVSYEEKLYISTIDGNINHCPTIDKGYWKEFQTGGGGVNPIREITGDAELQGGNDYICTNRQGLHLSLPQGTENAIITIFAQQLESNATITILPYNGETIMGQDLLTMETSYSSVKLLWIGAEWKVLSPFVPEMFESQENNENVTGIQETVDDTSINARLNRTAGGTVYRFTQPLDSFVLENIDYNINESIVIFKTSANASSLEVPVDKIINHQGTQIPLQSNKNYILRIQVGYLTYAIMD